MIHIKKLPPGIILIIVFFILSSVFWIFGQGGALVMYDSAAELGLQHDLRISSDPAIIEVNRGIAFSDVIIQLPLFIIGGIGLLKLRFYGAVSSWMALSIHLYWTTAAWAKQFFYLNASIKCEPFPLSLHFGLAFFFLFSVWACFYLYKNRSLFE